MTNIASARSDRKTARISFNEITAKPTLVIHPTDGEPLRMDFTDSLFGTTLASVLGVTVTPAGSLSLSGTVDGKVAYLIPAGQVAGQNYSATVRVLNSDGFWLNRVLNLKCRSK